METKEFERLAKLEQVQTDSIKAMDKHIEQDSIMLGEIRGDIKDIYDKLSSSNDRIHEMALAQTRQGTIIWLVGALVVLVTPTVTAFVVVYMMSPHK